MFVKTQQKARQSGLYIGNVVYSLDMGLVGELIDKRSLGMFQASCIAW